MSDTTALVDARDGSKLFERAWRIDEPRGVILIVHGISEHIGRYAHVAEYLNAAGFDVLGYDHRGHGQSAGDRAHIEDFDHLLDDAELMVRRARRGDVPLVVYGHSMGGLIATLYAESARPQPDLYVLSAPALDSGIPKVLKVLAPVIGRVLPKLRPPAQVKGHHLSRDPVVGEEYFSDPLVFVNVTARFGDLLLRAMEGARTNIDRIRRPTLVVHGTDDELVPPAASAPLAASSHVERKLFPGLRHEVHNEPEAVEVLSFIVAWLDAQLDAD